MNRENIGRLRELNAEMDDIVNRELKSECERLINVNKGIREMGVDVYVGEKAGSDLHVLVSDLEGLINRTKELQEKMLDFWERQETINKTC